MANRIAVWGLGATLLLASCAGAPDASPIAGTTTTAARSPASTSSTSTTSAVPATSTTAPTSPTTAPLLEEVELATTPDGAFTYSVAYRGRDGTGAGFNGVVLVTDADGEAGPALRDVRDEFDEITEMVFGPDALVAWTSLDANYGTQIFIGRIADAGEILDAHRIPESNGQQVVGIAFNAGVLTIPTRDGVQRHDPATDPWFVNTAGPAPRIEVGDPLAPVLETEGFWAPETPGSWYRGDTLGAEPGCGASTLYQDDADGHRRILDSAIELDKVVDVDATPTRTSVGADTVGAWRVVVISTECAAAYEGRRLHWGVEGVDYGDGGPRRERPLTIVELDLDPVEYVIGVTARIDEQDSFERLVAIEVQVRFADRRLETVVIEMN